MKIDKTRYPKKDMPKAIQLTIKRISQGKNEMSRKCKCVIGFAIKN